MDDGTVSKSPSKKHSVRRRKPAPGGAAGLLHDIVALSATEVLACDPASLCLVYANKSALAQLGYRTAALGRLALTDIAREHPRAAFLALLEPLLRSERNEVAAEMRLTRRDGSSYPAACRFQLIGRGGGRRLVAFIDDLTGTQQQRERVRILDRVQRVISECRRACIGAGGESGLLQEICEAMVRCGEYRRAWIGLACDDAARSIAVGGAAGYEPGYKGRRPTCDSDGDQEVMGRVIGGGRPYIEQNLFAAGVDPSRRERALAGGYQSTATLPLLVDGHPIGGIGLYAAEAHAFDSETLALLTELAAEIAFGISTLRARAARDEAEQALRESEQRLRAVFEQAAVGITRVDLGGVLIDANQKFADMLGYTRAELIGRRIRDVTHPDDYGRGAQHRRDIGRGVRKAFAGEKRFLRKDGTVVWARRTMSVAHDAAGRAQCIISVVEDISERKRVERRFELTFNQAAVGIVHTALPPDRRYLLVNQKFCEMVGYSAQALAEMNGLELTHPDDLHSDGDNEAKLLDGRIETFSSERRYIRKDGSIIWTNRTVSLVRDEGGRPDYLIRVVEDITARKELEERFRATFDHAPVGLMHGSLDGHILLVNRKFCEMTGYVAEALTGRPVREIHHPEDSEADRPLEERLIGGEIGSFTFEKRYVRRDGSTMWANRTVSLVRDASARPLYFICVVEDVTARNEAELRYRALFDAAPVGMLRTGLDNRILEVNPRTCEILGYSEQELLGTNLANFVHPDMRGTDGKNYLAPMLAGSMQTYTSERLFVRKSGAPVWVNRVVSLVRDGAGKALYFLRIIEDVSERRRAEEALRESERFATGTIDALPAHVCVLDEDGRIVAVNKSWRRFAADNGVPAEISWEGRHYVAAAELAGGKALGELRAAAGAIGEVLSGRRAEFSLTYPCHAAARERWFRMRATRFAGDGPRRGVIAHEDITLQILSERRRMMEHAITRVLAEAASVADVMPRLLRTVCEAMDWVYGAYWSWSEAQGSLTRREIWAGKDVPVVLPDEGPWPRMTLDRPGGLLRRAWMTKETTWIADIAQDASFRRREFALGAGFRSAYSFPVTVGPEVIGVAEFFGREVRDPDEMLLHATRAIGSQIGQFIQRKQTEETLRVSDERFRVAFEQASLGISMTALDLRYLRVNDKYCEITGYTQAEIAEMSVRDLVLPASFAESASLRERLIHGEIPSYQRERPILRKDGTTAWVNLVVTLIRDASGEPLHFVTMMQDVSERKRGEQALLESEEKFRQLADNVPEAFWIIDATTWELVYLNPAGEAMLGWSRAALPNDTRNWMRLIHREDRPRVRAAKRRLAENLPYDEEFRIVREDGSVCWIHDCAFPVRDAEGKVYRVAGISADITQRKEAEQKLVHLAHYDPLTGLPNRILFYDRLKQALAQARRNGWVVGVIFLDLDRFKNVNDTLGHAIGDELLSQASARLLGCVRAGDTVGRLGGDEFAIVLSGIAGQRDASVAAQKIMSALADPFLLEGDEVFVSASIGITLYPADSTDQDALMRNADTAMYRAKDLGRNTSQFYAPEMNARALEKLSMESSLRRALERKEFLLYYQPKVSLASGEVTGVEALLRWRHPELGLIAPGDFMPVLEETGLIVPTGEWVIRAACERAREWREAGMRPVPIAVNLSARQFQAKDLSRTVRHIIEECGIEGRLLELEITESSLVGNTEEAVRTLDALGALGIRIAIDDFGTGYSNLNYLKRFPLDALKIDSSFVRDVITDADDAAITRAIITMAHYLDLSVIAEGVETEQQLSFLQANGCDEVQGYYFSRPLPAEDCAALIAGGRRLARLAPETGVGAPAVLLVDDDEDALLLLQRELNADGYRIYTALDASEGLRLLDLHNIKVVVSDYSMPGMSGADFLQRVKALHPDTVRIMLTSHADFDTVTKAVNKSAIYRFVSKDWDSSHLRADIRQALASSLQAEAVAQFGRERRPRAG